MRSRKGAAEIISDSIRTRGAKTQWLPLGLRDKLQTTIELEWASVETPTARETCSKHGVGPPTRFQDDLSPATLEKSDPQAPLLYFSDSSVNMHNLIGSLPPGSCRAPRCPRCEQPFRALKLYGNPGACSPSALPWRRGIASSLPKPTSKNKMRSQEPRDASQAP